ncbi:purine-cytosine permease family protein [Komagataeibacter xylinus]|uniref:purine-cytosine permease family protein n=1 Tax=Komagataeibacter xylinus TaxID=28448 RepID=UPI0007739AA6|nr:cytosine permease [Komagataeibacter xylinus]AZV39883.1 cytosine permease [Komagataeibacter xylinus]GBQ73748.1 cytosine/purines/uracil/thiamine/allantoin transporter [Komagataeibacter xylinus NBRC 15237]
MSTAFETHTIHQIPPDQRHGRARDLFAVWFSTNLTLLTVVTGALGPGLFGLSFTWSAIAVILGNLAGAVFMALHAAQGPMLGVPQMVQSRGQFGFYGAVPIIGLVVLMYIGFVASNFVVGGEALHAALPMAGRRNAILIIAVLSLVPCCMGYHTIHAWSKVVSWVAGAVILYCLWLGYEAFPPGTLRDMHGSAAGFFSTFSTAALWQIAYAPYVSDSSRYLPADEAGRRTAFLTTYIGTVAGTALPMMLGCMIALHGPGVSVATTLAQLAGRQATPVMIVLSLSIALGNAMSLYGGALSAITVLQTFMPDWRAALRERLLVTCTLVAIALGMALGMADSFMKSYAAFLDLLMAIMVPWTAINLTDYYLLRRGRYDVASFFRRDGGAYGYCNIPALCAYGIGIAIEIPFMQNGFHTGSLARRLHGVDISWVVGLLVTAAFYIRATTTRRRT